MAGQQFPRNSDDSKIEVIDIDDDQDMSSNIFAIRFRDNEGMQQTILTNATGFTFRKLKPQKTPELKKIQGLMYQPKINHNTTQPQHNITTQPYN